MSSKNLTEITMALNASICFDQMINIGTLLPRRLVLCSHSEAVNTSAFHAGGTGSNPVGSTIILKKEDFAYDCINEVHHGG